MRRINKRIGQVFNRSIKEYQHHQNNQYHNNYLTTLAMLLQDFLFSTADHEQENMNTNQTNYLSISKEMPTVVLSKDQENKLLVINQETVY